MAETYRIERIADLLAVPKERRADCLRAIEYGLALVELAHGDGALEVGAMEWTDDGDKSVTLHDASGGPALTLEVTDKSDMQPNAEVSGAGTASAGLPGYAGDSKGE